MELDEKKEPKIFKNLNVSDDLSSSSSSESSCSKVKSNVTILNEEDETGGFTKFLSQNKNADDKVTRYLSCLEQNYYQKSSLQIRNSSSENETDADVAIIMNASSPASSNLIVPVVKQQRVTVNPKNCTLSTTSSSCISDEGCYGSSDFSSEPDKHNHNKVSTFGQVLNPNNISMMKNQLIISRPPQTTTTPSALINNQMKNYQSYCLSRFEKIYNNNNKNEECLVESTSGGSSRRDDSSLSSNSPNSQTAANMQQIITAISGSYV
jgi:hypothetical protein